MKEEGRKVAEMGGLHIVGTERHDARRIDNQLRGRAGRQGDPGSSRFYLSLEDDLMRIFAGEWVAGLLTRLGMEEGQAIESRMVSRRIEAAQKKVEERHFDSRKNLLEYDEVMDTQRKEVYGYRQHILEGGNCKIRSWTCWTSRSELAVERFLDREYGAAVLRGVRGATGWASSSTPPTSTAATSSEADKTAHDKAVRAVQTQRPGDARREPRRPRTPTEWNWQAMAHQVNTRWGLKTSDRELKKIGKDDLIEFLREKALESVVGHRPDGGQGVPGGGLGPAVACATGRG